jgi:hypothetical protein
MIQKKIAGFAQDWEGGNNSGAVQTVMSGMFNMTN